MSRGLITAWGWRLPYWRRVSPGPVGGAFFLALPFLSFLPLESLGMVEESGSGASALVWLLAAALGTGLGGGRGLREEDSVWLVQKGISLGESAMEDWILDMGISALACIWWAGVAALALAPNAALLQIMPAHFLLGFLTCLLARALVGFLSAWGARRPADMAVALVFLSLMAPLLLARWSDRAREVVGWLLPPFLKAPAFVSTLMAGELGAAAGALLHVLTFAGLLLGATCWRLERWRPRG